MGPKKKKVIVVGGGPAGMMAAGTAASRGYEVTLMEKMERMGVKLSITGGGRCNITRDLDVEDLLKGVLRNREFLYPAFYSLSGKNLMGFFLGMGLRTYSDDSGRVYPVTNKARDVVESLKDYLRKNNVNTRKGRVISLMVEDGKVKGVSTDLGETFDCARVILATGGKSYPATGSSGEGYEISRKVGHTIIDPKPALTPIETVDDISPLQGISISSVNVELMDGKGGLDAKSSGSLLFTHYGLSGPAILELTGYLQKDPSGSSLKIDLFPDIPHSELKEKVASLLGSNPRKRCVRPLCDLMPEKVALWILKRGEVDPDKPSNQVTGDERRRILKEMKSSGLSIKRAKSFDDAIVTAGGGSVKEIDPKTMESRIVKGLYFAGEVMDVHGTTGGYNLQIAFSTGYLSGMSC